MVAARRIHPGVRSNAVISKGFWANIYRAIGHVKAGYTLESLSDLFPRNYKLKTINYSTGIIANIACFVFYRVVRNIKNKYVRNALGVPLLFFKWLDFFNGERLSSSLFAVYQKMW